MSLQASGTISTEATAAMVERLAEHRTVGGAPYQELEWLARHGTIYRCEAGEYLARKDQTVSETEMGLAILLSGHVKIHIDRGGGPRVVMEWQGGDLFGVLPFSRMNASPGDAIAHTRVEALMIPRETFAELIRECPSITARCVHVMLDRARVFNTSDWQDEKMASLGRLAAGLAHELNNPASAVGRIGKLLQRSIQVADGAVAALALEALDQEQLGAIERFRAACSRASTSGPVSSLERARREQELTARVEAYGVAEHAVEVLLDTSVTVEELDALAGALNREALAPAVEWVAASCAIRTAALENELAAARITDLVGAMKRLTHMDRAPTPEPIDLNQDLRDTVAILDHKARSKQASVEVEIAPGMPQVYAIGGELNQVWMNLLDNALDAIGPGGRVRVSVRPEGHWVLVSVVDDGAGIQPEHRTRVFDPFFTTKPPGQGTGLGLEVARARVRGNGGDITFDSEPGRTEFRVYLPLRDADPAVAGRSAAEGG